MKRIVIDPGHSGFDRGATPVDIDSGGYMEDEFNWRLSEATSEALIKGWVCEVHLTHPHGVALSKKRDLDEELRLRGSMLDFYHADLFVSLHHDAGPPEARGGSLYVWTNKRAEDGGLAWLPAVGNHKAMRSYPMALKVKDKVKPTLAALGIPWRGDVMCADFGVLRYANGPCMLIEALFGSNAEDIAIARKPEFFPALGKAIAEGIADALALPVKVAPKPDNAVTVFVDGAEVACDAVLVDGATVVKLRPLAEAMGGKVGWDGDKRAVLISTGHLPPWQGRM